MDWGASALVKLSKINVYLYSASSRVSLMCYRFLYVGRRRWSPQASCTAKHQRTLRHHGYGLVYHAMCISTPRLSPGTHSSLPTEGALSLNRFASAPRWFTRPKMVTHSGTNQACHWVTTSIESNVLPLHETSIWLHWWLHHRWRCVEDCSNLLSVLASAGNLRTDIGTS